MDKKILALFQVYRFFWGYNFFVGVRLGIGIFMPILVTMIFGGGLPHIISVGFSAMAVGIADQLATFRYKKYELSIVCVVIILIAAVIGALRGHLMWTFLALLIIIFFSTLLGALGKKIGSIGFSFIFMALISTQSTLAFPVHLGLSLFGGVSYAVYSLIVAAKVEKRMMEQMVSDVYFATAHYMRHLSACYRQNNDLDMAFSELIQSQSQLLEAQQNARELIYRSDLSLSPSSIKITNQLLLLIEMHERMMYPQQDFRLLRETFCQSDIQIFFRDLLSKAGQNLEEIALDILGASQMNKRFGFKAELRALEYEIELYRTQNKTYQDNEEYILLIQHYRKAWAMTRQMEKMRALQLNETSDVDNSKLMKHLNKFVDRDPWSFSVILRHLFTFSAMTKHAIRVTLAAAFILLLVYTTDFLNHGFWVLFTAMAVMRADFTVTHQRSNYQVMGTVIGCMVTGLIFALDFNLFELVGILFICLIFSNGLINLRYDVSVAFNSVFVLILSNFQSSSGLWLAVERIADTLLGATIALAASFLFPVWERNNIGRLHVRVLRALDHLASKIDAVYFRQEEDAVEYRLARKAMQMSLADMMNALQRMQKEPKKQQGNLAEWTKFVVNHQSLLSQMNHLAAHLEELKDDPKGITELYELFQLIQYRIKLQSQEAQANTMVSPESLLSAKEVKPLIWQLERVMHVTTTVNRIA